MYVRSHDASVSFEQLQSCTTLPPPSLLRNAYRTFHSSISIFVSFSHFPSDFVALYVVHNPCNGLHYHLFLASWIYNNQPSNVLGSLSFTLFFFSFAFAVSSFLTYLSSK